MLLQTQTPSFWLLAAGYLFGEGGGDGGELRPLPGHLQQEKQPRAARPICRPCQQPPCFRSGPEPSQGLPPSRADPGHLRSWLLSLTRPPLTFPAALLSPAFFSVPHLSQSCPTPRPVGPLAGSGRRGPGAHSRAGLGQ